MANDMIEATVSALYWLVIALVLVGAVLGKWLCDRLESHHPEVWRSLGEPSLFLGASIQAQRRTSKFLWNRAYEDLGDERLNRVAGAAKILAVLIVVLFSLALGGFAYLRF